MHRSVDSRGRSRSLPNSRPRYRILILETISRVPRSEAKYTFYGTVLWGEHVAYVTLDPRRGHHGWTLGHGEVCLGSARSRTCQYRKQTDFEAVKPSGEVRVASKDTEWIIQNFSFAYLWSPQTQRQSLARDHQLVKE